MTRVPSRLPIALSLLVLPPTLVAAQPPGGALSLAPLSTVTVDSTFPGYGTAVLHDGKWIPLDRQVTQDYGSPDRLGNSGNSWVSAAQPGADHWVRLDWPQPVTLSRVDLWWTIPEWYPTAFRLEALVSETWQPLAPEEAWLVATAQCTTLVFPPCEVRALRVAQHPGGGGDRGLMAAQEVVALRQEGASPSLKGAREATAEEIRRLSPRRLERNIARLHLEQPGADRAVAWSRAGPAEGAPALADGDLRAPVELPSGPWALGVRWPIQHVIDGAALYGRGAASAVVAEFHDGLRWQPVTTNLKAEAQPDQARVLLTFEPLATDGFRVRLTERRADVTELEVYRYLPAAPDVWPERLVTDSRFERELLASGHEPSYEDLCSAALSMRPAHALLGLKDTPREVGVAWDGRVASEYPVELRFGGASEGLAEFRDTVTRTLIDGWRPGTVVSGRLRDLAVRETAFVSFAGPGREHPCLYLRVELTSLSEAPLATVVEARVEADAGAPASAPGGRLFRGGSLALATAHPGAAAKGGALTVPVRLGPGRRATIDFVQPYGGRVTTGEAGPYLSARYAAGLAEFHRYWDELLAPATDLQLPEARLNRMYRAVLAQLLINADGDIMPYGSAPSSYEGSLFGLEEGYAMMALTYLGFAADAQRYMSATYLTPEFLRKAPVYREYADRHQQYRNGLQPYYAVSVYRFSRDEAWIRRHLPVLRECAEWTIAQRRATMQLENGLRPLHWGLLPKWSYGGDIADLQCYPFYANFACWRGMAETAWLMGDLGDPAAAARYTDEAREYRSVIDRAVEGSYQPSHVPPFLPLQLYATEPVADDYHQLFAGALLDLQPFDPRGEQIGYTTDYLERANLLFCRLPRFRRDAGPGGLDALYGLGYVLTKLAQDKVDEFLLAFYGYQAFNLERDTYASRETNLIYASDLHVRSRYPVPDASDPLPCSSAVALHFLRHMLVTEEMDGSGGYTGDLLLLSGAPRAWFRDGRRMRVSDAPTHFGAVSFEVTSHLAERRLEATVRPPTRDPFGVVKLRLRHPDGLPFRRVLVNGRALPDMDLQGERIVLRRGPTAFRVTAEYDGPKGVDAPSAEGLEGEKKGTADDPLPRGGEEVGTSVPAQGAASRDLPGGQQMVSPESREYLRQLRQTPSFGASGFNLEELRVGMASRREPADPAVQCRPVEVGGLPGEWVLAPGADPDVRLLYLHGGGYVSGSGAFYLAMAAHLSAAGRCAVLLPDYRLAPEHPFPAAVEDCVRAYQWLTVMGPDGAAPAKATFIAGDSAGGGLTLATLMALRDRKLPLPRAGIALSPFADLTLSGGSIRSEAELDPIMHPRCLPDFVALYVADSQVRDPLASPLFGDYTGLPPLLIQVGEHEVIRDDSVRVAAKARAAGVDVTLEVWEGMFHVFQSHEPLLPEAREAIEHIGAVIRQG